MALGMSLLSPHCNGMLLSISRVLSAVQALPQQLECCPCKRSRAEHKGKGGRERRGGRGGASCRFLKLLALTSTRQSLETLLKSVSGTQCLAAPMTRLPDEGARQGISNEPGMLQPPLFVALPRACMEVTVIRSNIC